MADTGDLLTLRGSHKAITTLLPYAAWQERDGQPEMLDAFLCAARVTTVLGFTWYRAIRFADVLPFKATLHAMVLALPHIPWNGVPERGDLVQRWVATVSAVAYTEEVAQSVVDALLRISSREELSQHITFDAWSWLKKRPSLPPLCMGRRYGTYLEIVKAVQGLGDIEVLKSYLVIVWSEYDALQDGGFDEMCISIPKDFGGIGMGHHRADLIQRLDYVLGQLDLGIEHLNIPRSEEYRFTRMKDQYGKLRDILLEVNVEAIARASYPMIIFLSVLTQADTCRIPRDVYVCPSTPVVDPCCNPRPC